MDEQLYIVYHVNDPDHKIITNDFETWLKENNIDRRLDADEAEEEEDEFVVEDIEKYIYSKKDVKKINKKYKEVITKFGDFKKKYDDDDEDDDEDEDNVEKKKKKQSIKWKGMTYTD